MLQQAGTGFFLVNIGLMVGLSQFLFFFLLKKGESELLFLLMTGMILGTFLVVSVLFYKSSWIRMNMICYKEVIC